MPPPVTSEAVSLSARAIARLSKPRFVGEFTDVDARERGCTLIVTEHGAQHAPDHINLYLLVDGAGSVNDVRYRTAAKDLGLVAYDMMAELCLGKILANVATITPRQVDALLRDPDGQQVMLLGGDADKPYYVLVKAAERGAATPEQVPVNPLPTSAPSTSESLPWMDVGLFEKVRRIESVLDQHVRPALASDGGGIDLVDLKSDELFVQYHGACGSCASSIGGTLQFIQDSLNNHLKTALVIRVTGADEGLSI